MVTDIISHPWLLFAMAVVLFIVAIAWICRPRIGMAGLILLFLFVPLYPAPAFEYVFYAFALCSSVILLVWLVIAFRSVSPSQHDDNYSSFSTGLKLWILMCFLGLPLSLIFNSGHFSERLYYFIKGFLPFWYLCSFFVVWRLRPQALDAQRVLRCIMITAAGFAALSWAIYVATGARVTWFYHPLAFPFVVLGANIAFACFLSAQKLSLQLGWTSLIGFFVAAIVFTFTKAQMVALLCGFGLVIALLHGPSYPQTFRRTITLALSGILIGFVSIFCLMHNEVDSFTDLLSARITDAGTTSTRLEEWQNALLEFEQSPVIGKGIGFQLERTEFDETITAGYVHNQLIYTAMTTGIVGLAIYLFIISNWIRFLFRVRLAGSHLKMLLAACHACILSLFVYSLLFAGFRTIQHNYLLGVLLALTVALTPQPKQSEII